jgi:hypothetical protein
MKFVRLGIVILLFTGMNTTAWAREPHPTPEFSLEQPVGSDMPSFENRLETDHFVLKWTNMSGHPPDNINDPQIIKDTAGYLEQAWSKYTELFGRQPYTAPGRDKIEVVFRDIDCYGYADPPDGPIQLSSVAWVNPKHKRIRKPTSAHELFHKMQYAYGFKTRWLPPKPYRWFSEGTAAWSEVYVWGMVSHACKVDELFKDAKMDLYEADDVAMPFWIYFVHGNHEHPDNQLMRKFFEACERLQDENLALNEVITATYGSVDNFFKDFARDRKTGFWSGPGAAPYRSILGPDGQDIVAEVKDYQSKQSRNN